MAGMAETNIIAPRPAVTLGSTKTRTSKQPGHHAGSNQRNEEARDKRAAAREDAARRAALTERLEDQRHDIQRETLLELQDELQQLARATVQILMFDRNNPGGRAAGTVRLPDELDTGFA